MSIWVCGEVLIDILPTGPVVGGGPANTAKALARLGMRLILLMEFLVMLMVLAHAKS
jgi:sugar/nucleoside kinase (ribokinase family)